jgi:hypothetical protein
VITADQEVEYDLITSNEFHHLIADGLVGLVRSMPNMLAVWLTLLPEFGND